MSRIENILKNLIFGTIFSIRRRERQRYELVKWKFGRAHGNVKKRKFLKYSENFSGKSTK